VNSHDGERHPIRIPQIRHYDASANLVATKLDNGDTFDGFNAQASEDSESPFAILPTRTLVMLALSPGG
jgi:hypothetical protein